MSASEKIKTIVEEALVAGHLSEEKHEWILKEINRDGTIDPQESALLSQLFRASQDGSLVIGEAASHAPSSSLEARKRAAINRHAEQEERKALGRTTVPQENTWPEAEANAATTASVEKPESPEPEAGLQDTSSFEQRSTSVDSPSFEEVFDSALCARNSGPSFLAKNDRLLDILLEGKVWMKTGAMVGYFGNITFTREGISEHGLRKMVKKAITGEGASLTKAIGSGCLYLADQGKKISIIDLRGQSLTVSGHSILAFEDSIDWDITFLKQVAAMITGGLFQVRLCGMGVVAISTHFDPIVLRVTPANPVMTDYHATVAWSNGVNPSLKTDIGMQTMIGRSSGETLQLAFHGDGFVVIQPYEEVPTPDAAKGS